MSDMTKTQQILLEMLKERVPTSFLDSGGTPRYEDGKYVGSDHGYGRHFERNQDRDFGAEPATTVEVKNGDISVVHNLFHWCDEKLTYDEDADAAFYGPFLAKWDPDGRRPWSELIHEFPKWYAKHKTTKDRETEYLAETDAWVATGIYGDEDPVAEYTYNNENLLSQDILFVFFDLRIKGTRTSAGEYVVLQIHGGADARGGFTKPHVFTCNDELSVFDYGKATIWCQGPRRTDEGQLVLPGVLPQSTPTEDHSWSTTDGYCWEPNHSLGWRLEQYEMRELKEIDERDLIGMSDEAAADARNSARWVGGLLFWKPDGTGLCPMCGGTLEASSM